jgi:filamentous hemagglutinin
MPAITIDERRTSHIFRDAEGHFNDDTEANRRLLIEVASRTENFLGTDRVGNAWYAENRADGTQIWVRVRGDRIVNGGINRRPRDLKGLPR